MTRTVKFKVCAMQSGFAVLFLLTFCAFGIPAGIMLSIAGVAVKLFNAQFIVTSLTPELMIFGGLAVACGSAFLGLAAVKAGFVISRLFLRVKRRCDICRGWKPY